MARVYDAGAALNEPKVHDIRTMKKHSNDAEALKLLTDVARQVQPIMRKRQWIVPKLSEFFPANECLLGLNVGGGGGRTREIKIRLRRPRAPLSLLPFNDVLGTMLHELVHNVRGPHDSTFYKLLDELWNECEDLMDKGITGTGSGFDGPSAGRLGSHGFIPVHNPPTGKLRDVMLKAVEERAKRQRLCSGGPRRLGGNASAAATLGPAAAAAAAAERRARDNLWCPCERIGLALAAGAGKRGKRGGGVAGRGGAAGGPAGGGLQLEVVEIGDSSEDELVREIESEGMGSAGTLIGGDSVVGDLTRTGATGGGGGGQATQPSRPGGMPGSRRAGAGADRGAESGSGDARGAGGAMAKAGGSMGLGSMRGAGVGPVLGGGAQPSGPGAAAAAALARVTAKGSSAGPDSQATRKVAVPGLGSDTTAQRAGAARQGRSTSVRQAQGAGQGERASTGRGPEAGAGQAELGAAAGLRTAPATQRGVGGVRGGVAAPVVDLTLSDDEASVGEECGRVDRAGARARTHGDVAPIVDVAIVGTQSLGPLQQQPSVGTVAGEGLRFGTPTGFQNSDMQGPGAGLGAGRGPGPAGAGKRTAIIADHGPWVCQACTYVNEGPGAHMCEVCCTPAPAC